SKGLYKYIATSGSSDYAFERVDGERVIKKRSHDPKKAGKEVCEKYYFEDLRNPTEVRIPEFYITYEILKCGEYGQRYESNYQYSRVVPGDKIPKVKYVRIFTLNQFLFQTEEQYDRWKKEDKYARNSTGLSAERYDYDWDTDSVNLEQMLKRVDAAIAEGSPKYQRCNSIKNYNRHIGRVGKPYKIKEKLDKIREQATRYFDYPDSSYIIKITPDNQR
ncbi:MAG: hypothetical protein SAK42_23185, partial [Oscillatoria sp. PMC 1076.18]|nr:hypothetical protein [Oscillatoria sp. PMC 1076.18]